MSVKTQIDRLTQAVADTYTALEEAGADMPAVQNADNLPKTAAEIKAVLYSKSQSLTIKQKQQARENIGAMSDDEMHTWLWDIGTDMLLIQGTYREFLADDGSIDLLNAYPTFGPRLASKFIATSVDKTDSDGNPITLVLDLENNTAQFVSAFSPGGDDVNHENHNEVQTTPYTDGAGNTIEFDDVFDGECWYIDPCLSVFSAGDLFYIKRLDSDER